MGFLGKGARRVVIAREDWVLLVLAASDGLLPVQLQKSLFLLGQRFPQLVGEGFYEFRPIGGGDFSEQINSDAHAFLKAGLLTFRAPESGGGQRYRLTSAGTERAIRVEKQVPPALAQSLRNVVSWVKTRSIDQLLRGSSATAGSSRPGSEKRDSVWSR